jgi:molybdopterin-guanine dinucleotide biosynthesis protein A
MKEGPAAAVILAGGQSRRMQREKSLLPLDGRAMIESIIAQIAPHFAAIIISAAAKNKFAYLGLPTVEDERPGEGPLLAILSALRFSPHAVNFILACDIPFIHVPFMKKLLSLADGHDIVVPRYRDGKYEPLFAVYQRRIIPAVEAQVAGGDRKIASLFTVCRTRTVPMDGQKWFRNLNTIKEYDDYIRQNKKSRP